MPDSPPPPYTTTNTSSDASPPAYTANTDTDIALTRPEVQELRAYLANLSLDDLEELIRHTWNDLRRIDWEGTHWENLYIYMKEVEARKNGGTGWDGEFPPFSEMLDEIVRIGREGW